MEALCVSRVPVAQASQDGEVTGSQAGFTASVCRKAEAL